MYDNEIYSDFGNGGAATENSAAGNFSNASVQQEQAGERQEQPKEPYRTEQEPYRAQQESYRAEQEPYRQVYPTAFQPAQKQEPAGNKKPGYFTKMLVSVSLGILFGIFAGIGFFAVQQGMNTVQRTKIQEEIPGYPQSDKAEPETAANKEIIQPTGSGVVYASKESEVPDIVDSVMPAMVSVINNYTERASFWGQVYEEELSSSGSGIIVGKTDEELLIVSNHHVVAGADKLLVTLIDGTEAEARIKGLDSDMDLAVLSVDLDDLSEETEDAIVVATLGESDSLRMGQRVIAIGNALGYGQSATVGYISALNREIELEDGSSKSFIQTDAAINPGNSGGALLNMAGEVIGINSNKIGGSAIEGMGYAIPITAASPIIAELMERQTREKVSSSRAGYIGITYQDVTDQISAMFGMPKGVCVTSVLEGTGAEAAGMLKGDIIVKFDGSKITAFADLQKCLQYYAAGDTAKITVMRAENGEYVEHELTVTLSRKPKNE